MSDKVEGNGQANQPTRRQFLGQTAAAALASASVAASLQAAPAKEKPVKKVTTRVLGANDRINLAFIGNGMQFLGLLQRGFQRAQGGKEDFEFAAVCDVWEPRVNHAQEKPRREKAYRDYREILARPDIDGVVIAVPDHWHYPMAREALLAGQGRLPRKAHDLHDRRGRQVERSRESDQARPPGRRLRARHPALLEGQRLHQGRQDGQDPLGPDQLQPEYRRRHVGLPDSRRWAASPGPMPSSRPKNLRLEDVAGLGAASDLSARSAISAGGSSGITPAATRPTCSTTASA